ncbi:MAG: DUF2892 domain-containing protein [Thermaerobacter sp.]|nr:DUF2892 domain-containing protein [Thermaerobacter sp.]
MPVNVGTVDRVIRIILAIALGYFAHGTSGVLSVVLWVVAVVLLITGAIGRCGIYAIFGLHTCPRHVGDTDHN